MSKEQFCRPLQCAHEWVSRVVQQGDTVVDATAGNGHDSLFLARLVGTEGRVHIFDIQQQALDSTRDRLDQHGCLDGRIKLHLCSHNLMREHVDNPPKAIMFNLGYLPGGDKAIISKTETTLQALEAALTLLAKGGLLTVVCYPGHEGGHQEAKAVKDLMSVLSIHDWTVSEVSSLNGPDSSPFLIAMLKG